MLQYIDHDDSRHTKSAVFLHSKRQLVLHHPYADVTLQQSPSRSTNNVVLRIPGTFPIGERHTAVSRRHDCQYA